ncbi:SIS domain-containing protein [Rhodovulum sulfidophilum]|nr:SIS domain-containing protein [Rhodovulum sulfidophilum]
MTDTSFSTANIEDYFGRVQRALGSVDPAAVARIAGCFEATRVASGTIYLCGNGGSAATASHAACDLMLFPGPSEPHLRASVLSDHTPLISALSNDFSYADAFAEYLRRHAGAADVVVGVSVSGASENVLRALETGQSRGTQTVGLTGDGTARMEAGSDVYVPVPNSSIQAVEDVHMSIFHAVSLSLRHGLRGG